MEENNISKSPKQSIEIFNYAISAEKKGKQYHYILEEEGRKIWQYLHKDSPSMQNPTGQVVRGLVKKMSGNVEIQQGKIKAKVSDEDILNDVITHLEWLDELLIAYEENKEQFKAELEKEEYGQRLEELSEKSEEFIEFLDKHNMSIIDFIKFSSEWLSGGESRNTIVGFICHLSTYFKIKAVWFFALGKAGEGKSVIDNASTDLMPEEALFNGRVSEKALYRKSQKYGSNYLDGKILLMKDLGGKLDIEKWSDTINRYKELTTDGKAEFEVVGEGIDEETGERVILVFMLEGYPSVSLSSVNTESFDDQLMSRGVNVSPVATDAEVRRFHKFNKGKIKKRREYIIKNYIPKLHNYINYIREFYDGIEIINPYWTCLEKWFRKSEYYKRALTLYPSLVEAVCLLNYVNRETVNVEEDMYIVATKEDNQIVADLFNPSQGISEPAVRVFNLLLKWYDTYNPDELVEYQSGDLRIRQCKTIFSVGEVRYKASKIKSLKGLPYGDIMASLVNHGLIEAVDKEKRSNKNIYVLSHHEPLEPSVIEFDEDMIERYIYDLEWIYGVSATHLKKLVDHENGVKADKPVDSDLKLPPWVSSSPDQVLLSPLESASSDFESAQVRKTTSQVRSSPPKKMTNHEQLSDEDKAVKETQAKWSGFE